MPAIWRTGHLAVIFYGNLIFAEFFRAGTQRSDGIAQGRGREGAKKGQRMAKEGPKKEQRRAKEAYLCPLYLCPFYRYPGSAPARLRIGPGSAPAPARPRLASGFAPSLFAPCLFSPSLFAPSIFGVKNGERRAKEGDESGKIRAECS